jgi:hypothetical protein
MITEIYGKPAYAGSEDQLTGDVFGAFRYIRPEAGLLPFLKSAYEFKYPDRKQLEFSQPNHRETKFWPWLHEAEPDVVIELDEENGRKTIVVIEVKYRSGLSSDDPSGPEGMMDDLVSENDDESDRKSNNQLVREMRGTKCQWPGSEYRKVLVFLTAEQSYPSTVFDRVRKRAAEESLDDIELYWLSWHDLPDVLRGKQDSAILNKFESNVVKDLLALCERKGFERFNKLRLPSSLLDKYKFESVFLEVSACSIKFASATSFLMDKLPMIQNHMAFDKVTL